MGRPLLTEEYDRKPCLHFFFKGICFIHINKICALNIDEYLILQMYIICMYACLHACMYVCMCVCICVLCMCVYVFMHVCMFTITCLYFLSIFNFVYPLCIFSMFWLYIFFYALA
ncbi:hypothetical protein KP509_11G029200 [Ceratopteris richardii]|uniref:Uncharacterized protein n=1 Tax=Ceratopteris richardii TaxID=49495 RepID=A0A8T2TTY3_CERRI|nr:hypothetical protein KP509_11G029200 [Ceratopteris richardii]